MCGQPCLSRLGSNGRRDHGGAVTIPGVVLDDQDRPDAALLAAHHRGEIGIVNIAALDTRIHKVHTPPKEVPVTESPFNGATLILPRSFGIYTGPTCKIPASLPVSFYAPGCGEVSFIFVYFKEGV